MSIAYRYGSKEAKKIATIFYELDKKFCYIRHHLNFSSDQNDRRLVRYQKEISRIQYALKSLNAIEAYMITETFRTDGSVNNEWWKGIFPKTTLYRLRKVAMLKFLNEYGVNT